MPVKKFDISQAGEVAEYLGKSIDAAAERAVMSLAHAIVARILTVIIPAEPRQPVDRGAYRAAWRAKKTHEGAEVRNDMPYAGPIEFGVRAENVKIGRKMIDALAAWVIRKGLVKKQGKGKKASDATLKAARGMAWAIAKKMKERGIFNEGKGLHILDKATANLDKMFADTLGEELQREYGGK